MFNTGFGVFTVGSLLCGLSFSVPILIASRAVQAFGGALMQANSGAIAADTFPAEVRGTAYGYISLGWTSGAVLGIVLGGIITTYCGWEYIFFINIPIGIVATVLGWKYVRDSNRARARLDTAGMVLLGIALTLISYAGVDFAGEGLASINMISAGLGVFALLLFAVYESKIPFPIIRLADFKSRILKYSVLAAFFLSLGYLSVMFLITMYLQGIRGFSPLDAALLLTPGYIIGSLLSPKMGQLSDRYGARILATAGASVLILATGVYLLLQLDTPVWVVLVASGISGIGSAMFFPSNNSAVMANAPEGAFGSISGVLRTVQNIGILGSFVIAITVASLSIPRDVAFEVFLGTTNLVGGVSQEFLNGIDASLWASIALMGCAAILSWMRGHEERRTVPQD